MKKLGNNRSVMPQLQNFLDKITNTYQKYLSTSNRFIYKLDIWCKKMSNTSKKLRRIKNNRNRGSWKKNS